MSVYWLSQDKAGVVRKRLRTSLLKAPPDPCDFIRDPYVLEFLDLQPSPALYEKDVEQGLIERLQQFMMELGKGLLLLPGKSAAGRG